MTPPHSTQLTLPTFRSSTETQSEIMRLCVQAHGRLFESGIAASDSLKLMMRSKSLWDLDFVSYGGVIADMWSNPYRQEQDCLVESIAEHCRGLYDRKWGGAAGSVGRSQRTEIRIHTYGRRIQAYLRSPQHPGLLIHESLLDCVPSQLRIRFHTHLFENPCTVGADRRDAQVCCTGNLTDGLS